MNNYEQNNNVENTNYDNTDYSYNYGNQNMMNYNPNGNTNYNNNKQPLSYYMKRFLVGLLLVVALIFLLLYLFPTKNGLRDMISEVMEETLNETLNEKLNPFYDRMFSDNLNTMKEVAIAYYTTERLPKEKGDTEKITLGEMIEMKLLLEIKDKDGNMCDLDESYVSITKEEKEYKMKVNLKCGDEEDYIVVYLGCYDYCLNDVCEKEEKEEVTTTYQASTATPEKKVVNNNITNIYKTFKKTITKNVTKITNIIMKPVKPIDPVKPDDPTPDDPTPEDPDVYKYLYEKEVSIDYDKQYSKWSDWSANIEYDPNNNNINWGQHEYVWNEKVGYKLTKYYEYIPDKSQPIYNVTYDRLLGYKKQYSCAGYTYYIDSVTETTYQVTDWVKTDRVTLSYKPTQGNTKKYVYVGMNYDYCAENCTLKPYFIFDVYERSAKPVSTSYTSVSATCNNVVTKEIPVYGKSTTFAGYVTDRVLKEKRTYYYHKKTRELIKDAYTDKETYQAWSYSKNDEALISQGYKYTGKYEKVTK